MTHVSRRLAVGLVMMLACTVAACGGSEERASTTTGAGTQAVATAAPVGATRTATMPAGETDPNGILKFSFGTNGGSNYDPHTAANPFVNTFLNPVYDALMTMTPDNKLEPQLAESYSFRDGGKTLQFKLRKNVVFHDGAPFNAQVVKANLERAKTNPKSTLKADLLPVESIEVVDDYTVDLKLSAPGGSLPALFADRAGMMISPNALNNTDLDLKPVGAGPYRVVDHQPGKVIAYERFEKYYNPTVQKLRRIEIHMVLDPDTRLRQLRSGEIDASALNADQIKAAQAAGLQVTTDPYAGAFILYLNMARSEFKNQKVRQALAMAIDRKAISDALHAGHCSVSAQVFPAGYWANDPNTPATYYKYDPAAAKKLLAEAGLPNGFSFTTVVINVPFYSAQAEAIQGQLAQIGVKMDVQTTEPAQLLSKFAIEKSVDSYFSTTGGFIDPAKTVAQLYLPNSTLNPGGYNDPKIVELALKGLEGTTEAERAPYYQQISRIAAELGFHIPICNGVNVTVSNKKVQVVRSNLSGAYDLRYAAVLK